MENTNIYNIPNKGCLIGAAYQAMTSRLDDALKAAGLPIAVPEYLILRFLYDFDGSQQCEIATALGKDKAAVCRTIGMMVKKNLVITRPVSHKCLRVFLAPLALEIKPKIIEVANDREKYFMSLGSPDDIDTFFKIIRRIINS